MLKSVLQNTLKKHGKASFVGSLCELVLGLEDQERYTDTRALGWTSYSTQHGMIEPVKVHEVK